MMKVTAPDIAKAKTTCLRITIQQVGNYWTLLIFHALAKGELRYMDLKRAIGNVSQRSLTQALRDLERDGYLTRKVFPSSPPKVEYRLTPLGQSLVRAMRSLVVWAAAHSDDIKSARARFDKTKEPMKSTITEPSRQSSPRGAN
jgi:DNA-binding HxlR family transcriptional regulator